MRGSIVSVVVALAMLSVLAPIAVAADATKRDTSPSGARRPAPRAPSGEATAPEPPQGPSAEDNEDEPPPPLAWVVLDTTKGEIVLELNREKAPITVENFLTYVQDDFYDGLIFHRVMSNFMIQGGGFDKSMRQKRPRPPIKNEWRNGLKNERGAIAMARLGGRPDSATSQFFINVVDNPVLDEPGDGAAYAVFGKVVVGMDVVNAIKVVPVTTIGRHENVPVEPIIIEEARQITEDEAKKAIEEEKDDEPQPKPTEDD